VLGSAVLGAPLWFSRREPRRLLLVAVITVHALAFALLFASHDRYHLPLLPVFSVLAAAAWVGALDRFRAGRPGSSL
jgi:ABC-type transport system involved in cytochrome c biogenesis permease subunit